MAVSNRRILLQASIAILIVLSVSYYFLYREALVRIDQQILDAHFRLRGSSETGNDIVIVALDPESSRVLQRKAGGWKRSDFASAIRILTDAGADLVAIDYLFLMPAEPEQDEELRAALQDSASVVLASKAETEGLSTPYEPFRSQEVGEGFISIYPDEDGSVRKIALAKLRPGEQGELVFEFPFSLAVALLRLYPDEDFTVNLEDPRYAQIGDLRIPAPGTKATDGFYINFAGGSGRFPRIPIHSILSRKFDPQAVHGKIVLIGNMNPAEHDYYQVPLLPEAEELRKMHQSGWPEKDMQSMYGVEIHANAIHTLLRRKFLAPLPKGPAALILLAAALLLTWLALGARKNAFVLAAISLLVLAVHAYASYRLFLAGIVVPSAHLYFAGLLITLIGLTARQVQEASERRHITQLFGRYVAPNVVKELIYQRDLVHFAGRKQRLSVFFSDVRGFTTMSEKMPPEEVSRLLNEYFSRMTRIVFDHGGTLDKFIGDALMAFFGNPIWFEDHARRAVSMAVDMRNAMQDLRNKWEAEGKDVPFDIGMGINTGEVVVGNLGSSDFFDYTVIGDNVNLACRLESIAKRGQIIISDSTYEEVKNFFEIRKLEPVMVKGKSQPIQIYEVLGRKPSEAL